MRRILYVTGTRADFGLMRSTLQCIAANPGLDLGVLVTGMHLDPQYGDTVREVEASGVSIVARVPVVLRSDDGATMARAIGVELLGVIDALESWRPDMVLLLGDRGEMLAGAIAALHLNIPIVHIHGGERSGTVDEPVRHAISKLAHYHFTATPGARERLVRMGERPETIFCTGAPGLDGLSDLVLPSRELLATNEGFDPERPIALVVFHPVVQQARAAADQIQAVIEGIQAVDGLQALLLMPNADAGGESIRSVLDEIRADVKVVSHLPREVFCHWLARADVMVGNSSSGVIEAATFWTPVVNVGVRQYGRERSANLVDVSVNASSICEAVREALISGRREVKNVYGDGRTAPRIAQLLLDLPLTPDLLLKCNAY
ncbi:UDP-N-acetylglucosamine 2-epimerase [Stutzerimonas nitrititolerans]|uniref:UDP-N-acetylglucosamine 2-epimerase n=1 Tax=Stutzerimonas nitrititolerans TaxID=2482751 RepID=UPI0028B02591|nr:UDP-N-acetylglucosamine 2-epimerase [Stutzerimonas nitrititolerans]